jgi:hypothetical protein
MVTAFDSRLMAAKLESLAPGEHIDLAKVAQLLRSLADSLDATLQVANNISKSMDVVYADRADLAHQVKLLTAEREHYRMLAAETSA